jgi:hypothetical protein
MEGFDPKTSFGHEVSVRYDAEEIRADETARSRAVRTCT